MQTTYLRIVAPQYTAGTLRIMAQLERFYATPPSRGLKGEDTRKREDSSCRGNLNMSVKLSRRIFINTYFIFRAEIQIHFFKSVFVSLLRHDNLSLSVNATL